MLFKRKPHSTDVDVSVDGHLICRIKAAPPYWFVYDLDGNAMYQNNLQAACKIWIEENFR